MAFVELRQALRELLSTGTRRPIVAYSGVWSVASAFPGPSSELVASIQAELLDAVGERTLIMPTYTGGFKDGVIDLDTAPGMTGMLNEAIRKMPGTRRTASAFFSFAARGLDADSVAALEPRDAWGDGSLFEWIEQQDAEILLLGVPLQMCSFLHRVEWRAQVPYRYLKEFSGRMIRGGVERPLRERLFVRSLDPVAENVWTGAEALLRGAGLASIPLGRGAVARVGARALVDTLLPVVRHDPYAYVKEPQVLRARFGERPETETHP